MRIWSPAFEHQQRIRSRYTCDDANVSPPLAIEDVPTDAESLVLIMDDPDAVSGTFIHWTVWNIDPAVRAIDEGRVPPGATEGVTSTGRPGYFGPCPPSGTHRYFFRLYALNTSLSLLEETSARELMRVMGDHVVERAEFYGLYSRAA